MPHQDLLLHPWGGGGGGGRHTEGLCPGTYTQVCGRAHTLVCKGPLPPPQQAQHVSHRSGQPRHAGQPGSALAAPGQLGSTSLGGQPQSQATHHTNQPANQLGHHTTPPGSASLGGQPECQPTHLCCPRRQRSARASWPAAPAAAACTARGGGGGSGCPDAGGFRVWGVGAGSGCPDGGALRHPAAGQHSTHLPPSAGAQPGRQQQGMSQAADWLAGWLDAASPRGGADACGFELPHLTHQPLNPKP